MSLLPGQIIPQTIPLGRVNRDGTVTIDKDWWLLLYHLVLNSLGTGSGLPADALQDLEGADTDAIDADAISLRQPISNALVQAIQPQDVVVSSNDLPDISRALLLAQDPLLADPPDLARALILAQDGLLSDPPALSQPVSSIAVGASPFTYTASFTGTVAVTGGTVSAISFIRRGTSVATGITSGLIPVSRYDQVQVTWTAAPTMTFIPWSSQ